MPAEAAAQRAPRPPLSSTLQLLPRVAAYLGHRDSLLALGTLALILSLLEWLGTLPWEPMALAIPLARVFMATYFFLVARKAALGSRRLPVPSDHLDTWETLFQPLLQVVLAGLPSLAALLIYAQARAGVMDFVERYQARPMVYLGAQGVTGHVLLGLFMIQMPLAILTALCTRRLVESLDPRTGLRLAWRTGAGYPIVFLAVSLLGLTGQVMDRLAMQLHAELPIPLAAPVLGHLLRLWAPLAQARVLGEFIHLHRDAIGPERG